MSSELKIEPLKTKNTLCGMEIDIITSAINEFGDCDHPYADRETVSEFTIGYIAKCLWTAAHRGWTDTEFFDLALRLRKRLISTERINKDITYRSFPERVIVDMEKDGMYWIKESGLNEITYDFAKPQSLLDDIVCKTEIEYDLVRSTSVYCYSDQHRWGVVVSFCTEVQNALDVYYKEGQGD